MKQIVAPLEALADPRLSHIEARVLMALFSYKSKASEIVWPSLPEIGSRCGISDPAKVSKITRKLQDLGWITKAKNGRTGRNEYQLHSPEITQELQPETAEQLGSSDQLGSRDQLGSSDNSNLVAATNSNLVGETKPIEQTTEQTTEQTKVKSASKLDFSKWPEEPDPQILADWKKVRNAKKAPLTQTAIDRLGRQFYEAANSGYSVNDCLGLCVERGWQGFKAEWIVKAMTPSRPNGQKPDPWSIEATGDTLKDNVFITPVGGLPT